MMPSSERRAFKRMTLESTVLFQSAGDTQPMHASGLDLSGNGISFVTDSSIRVGSEIDVRVMPTLQRLQPLNARVKVVRVHRDANRYVIAGSIEAIR